MVSLLYIYIYIDIYIYIYIYILPYKWGITWKAEASQRIMQQPFARGASTPAADRSPHRLPWKSSVKRVDPPWRPLYEKPFSATPKRALRRRCPDSRRSPRSIADIYSSAGAYELNRLWTDSYISGGRPTSARLTASHSACGDISVAASLTVVRSPRLVSPSFAPPLTVSSPRPSPSGLRWCERSTHGASGLLCQLTSRCRRSQNALYLRSIARQCRELHEQNIYNIS